MGLFLEFVVNTAFIVVILYALSAVYREYFGKGQ
jgi:hypothetical protein